jgi:ureidoglycolate lyase
VQIAATEITAEAFAPFGHVLVMAPPDASSPELVVSHGDNYDDCRTHDPLISTNGSLGVTRGTATPCQTARMERHFHTEEAIFCLADPIVLIVAPATGTDAPDAASLRAFIVRPGTVAVMREGTWHDACHGVGQPASYYWQATCRDDLASSWVEIEGGPVTVTAGA